jgi:hypothetical protein
MTKIFKKAPKARFRANYFIILKYFCLSIALFAIVLTVTFFAIRDTKIPRKEIALKIDIANKVNICLPEDNELFDEKSFFDF